MFPYPQFWKTKVLKTFLKKIWQTHLTAKHDLKWCDAIYNLYLFYLVYLYLSININAFEALLVWCWGHLLLPLHPPQVANKGIVFSKKKKKENISRSDYMMSLQSSKWSTYITHGICSTLLPKIWKILNSETSGIFKFLLVDL